MISPAHRQLPPSKERRRDGACLASATVALRKNEGSLGLEAQHPDTFLRNQFSLATGPFYTAIRMVRGRLRHPRFTVSLLKGARRGIELGHHHKRVADLRQRVILQHVQIFSLR